MDFTQIIIGTFIGVVQGLTEFLPVSSSAHLVFMHEITGFAPRPGIRHCTAHRKSGSCGMYFWNDVVQMFRSFFSSLKDLTQGRFKQGIREDEFKKLTWLVIIGTLPAGLAGIFFKDFFESLFSDVAAVGFFLLITGLLLWGSERISKRTENKSGLKEMGVKNSLLIGIAQAFAIAPGISRSGATISTGLFLGMERELAARFSFLLSIPAILGAALVQSKNISAGLDVNTGAYIAGFIAAAISGYLAIKLMLKLIKERDLLIFAYYCWIVGALVLILTLVL